MWNPCLGAAFRSAQLIEKLGFATPTTLITNEPGRAREFVARQGRVVFKSISEQRVRS